MKLTRFFLPAAFTLLFASSAWWTAHLAIRYRRQLQAQPAAAARLEQQIRRLRRERDALLSRLDAARQQSASAAETPSGSDAAPDLTQATEVERWVRQTKRLQQIFERRPDQKIPELALLTDLDWLRIARRVKLDTEDNLARAMAIVRNKAKDIFALQLQKALGAYATENHGQIPDDVTELRAYLDPSLDPALLAQYEMVGPGRSPGIPPDSVMKSKSLVDEDYDDRISFQRGEGDSFTYSTGRHHDPTGPADDGSLEAQIEYDLVTAVRAFAAKNQGALPSNPSELIPYFDPPLGPALTEMLKRPMTPEQQAQFPVNIARLAAGHHLPR